MLERNVFDECFVLELMAGNIVIAEIKDFYVFMTGWMDSDPRTIRMVGFDANTEDSHT